MDPQTPEEEEPNKSVDTGSDDNASGKNSESNETNGDSSTTPDENNNSDNNNTPNPVDKDEENNLDSDTSKDNEVETDDQENSTTEGEETSTLKEKVLAVDDKKGKAITPYENIVVKNNWTLWNEPYVKGAKKVGDTKQLFAKKTKVIISREATVGKNKYVLLTLDGKTIGWLNKWGVAPENPVGELTLYGQEVNKYSKKLVKNNWTVWSKPYEIGAVRLEKTNPYYNKTVDIIRRAEINGTVYVLIAQNNKNIGWVNKNAVKEPIEQPNGIVIPNTWKYVTKNNWTIWESPYNPGVKKVDKTNYYFNEAVLITRKARTSSGTYFKVWSKRNGKYHVLGWLRENGVSDNIQDLYKVKGELIPNTYGKIIKNNWTIWEKPYKPKTKALTKTNSYYKNQVLLFTRRAQTLSGIYYKAWAKKMVDIMSLDG